MRERRRTIELREAGAGMASDARKVVCDELGAVHLLFFPGGVGRRAEEEWEMGQDVLWGEQTHLAPLSAPWFHELPALGSVASPDLGGGIAGGFKRG